MRFHRVYACTFVRIKFRYGRLQSRFPLSILSRGFSNEYECFVCGQFALLRLFNRERKRKKKKFKIHAYIPLPSINGGAIRVRSWRICWIAARMKYLDTNIYICVCVKKDPRNNFPKSTFRIIENDRYSTISRWEIKRKKKIVARKKIFKIKIS